MQKKKYHKTHPGKGALAATRNSLTSLPAYQSFRVWDKKENGRIKGHRLSFTL